MSMTVAAACDRADSRTLFADKALDACSGLAGSADGARPCGPKLRTLRLGGPGRPACRHRRGWPHASAQLVVVRLLRALASRPVPASASTASRLRRPWSRPLVTCWGRCCSPMRAFSTSAVPVSPGITHCNTVSCRCAPASSGGVLSRDSWISWWADRRPPGPGTPELLVGGHRISRLGSAQRHHPLAGQGLGEPVRIALGHHQVGVVQQPVHGRGGEGLGHDLVEP
jgi:hypothetical protein